MVSKTIKISEHNYRKLLEIAAGLQKIRREKISFDDTIDNLVEKKEKKGNIINLAGAWKDMNDEEWADIKGALNKGWKKWKIKSV